MIRDSGRPARFRRVCRLILVGLMIWRTRAAAGQAETASPGDANPERPTFATHAYAVAPGFVELEQGLSTRGTQSLQEATSWDVNLKFGVTPFLQIALFGPLYARGPRGHGLGDLGTAWKLRTDVSRRTALALVSAVSVPTGSASEQLGSGHVLGSFVGVLSTNLSATWHLDVNAGPAGIGEGKPQWFFSLSWAAAIGSGRYGLTLETFGLTAGGAGPELAGVLGAATFRATHWAVVDAGGVYGATGDTQDQLFIGLTTNFGRLF